MVSIFIIILKAQLELFMGSHAKSICGGNIAVGERYMESA